MLRSFRRFQHKTFRWCFADNQMSNFTNGSAFCIDLIFASNTSYVTTGIKHSICDKCHHIYGSSILIYIYHHLIIGKYGNIKKRTLKLYKPLLLWDMAFQNKAINDKIKIMGGTLLYI